MIHAATRRSALGAAAHRSLGGSIRRGALAILSTQPITWGATLLTLVMAPRLLGSEAFGQYTMVFTIATLAGTVVGLGIPDWLVRRVAQRPDVAQREAGLTIAITLATACVAVVVLGVAIPLSGFPLQDNRLLYVALLGMFVVPVQGALFSWLRGRDDHVRFAWSNAASVAILAVLGVGALLLGARVLEYTLLGAIVPIVVVLIAFRLSGLRPLFSYPDLSEIRRVIAGGLPFLGCTLTQIVASTIDRVILGAMVPAAEVGWYAAANRIVYIPIFVPNLVSTPLFAALSRHANDTPMVRKAMQESLRVVLLLTVPLAAGLIVIAPMIPGLLGWPADFVNTVVLMQILAVSMPLMSVNTILVNGLMALGRERRWAWLSGIVTIVNILLNVAFIPMFESFTGLGAIGASAITGVTEVLMTLGILALVPREVLESRTLWAALRIILAGSLAGLAAGAALPIALPLSAAIGAVTYFGCAFLLKVLTLTDVRSILTKRFA